MQTLVARVREIRHQVRATLRNDDLGPGLEDRREARPVDDGACRAARGRLEQLERHRVVDRVLAGRDEHHTGRRVDRRARRCVPRSHEVDVVRPFLERVPTVAEHHEAVGRNGACGDEEVVLENGFRRGIPVRDEGEIAREIILGRSRVEDSRVDRRIERRRLARPVPGDERLDAGTSGDREDDIEVRNLVGAQPRRRSAGIERAERLPRIEIVEDACRYRLIEEPLDGV